MQKSEKANYILSQIDKKNFNIMYKNGYILLALKSFNVNKKFITISSHIDTTYRNVFYREDLDNIYGTLDNSATNFILLKLLQNNTNPQVLFIFTDNEETKICNLLNVEYLYHKNFKHNICLDVTPYCYYTHFATIENDSYKLCPRILKKNKFIANIEVYQSKDDESTILREHNIKSYSFCLTCNFKDNRCHSEAGGVIPKKNIFEYYNTLKKVLT